ncbi:MAG: hypothetical protein R3313_01320 [Candidatus Saccharimonadales bacterium]|nr:hypothetical protein [Candidatus Saccharimonadales bacterium]
MQHEKDQADRNVFFPEEGEFLITEELDDLGNLTARNIVGKVIIAEDGIARGPEGMKFQPGYFVMKLAKIVGPDGRVMKKGRIEVPDEAVEHMSTWNDFGS